MLEIKGATVRDSVASIRARLSPEQFSRFLEVLDPGARALCTATINISGWYSLDAFASLLDADIRELDGGDPSGILARAEKVIERQLSGIYRVFIRLGSPESLVKRIAATHATYFRGVDIEVRACERGRAAIRYRGYARTHASLEYAIRSFFKKGLELAGAKNVKVRVTTPIAAGTGICDVEMSWS